MPFQHTIWKHVEEKLINIEGTGAYYAGGTLSLPLGKDRGICLNLNGKGFVLNNSIKNTMVYLPEHITKLVREIYLKVCGKTEHYLESVK